MDVYLCVDLLITEIIEDKLGATSLGLLPLGSSIT